MSEGTSTSPSSAPAHAPAGSSAHHRAAFFRQSGWLMIATIFGGGLMWAVHFLAKAKTVTPEEYGLFGTMLAVISCVPILPLQMVFAQQTAKAAVAGTERALAGLLRLTGGITLGLAAVLALAVLLGQDQLESAFKIHSASYLWIMVGVIFFSVCLPILYGVMQGQQNFLWFGWVVILNAAGRVSGAALLVLLAGWAAAGMLIGVLLGLVAAVIMGLWQIRGLLGLKPEPFALRPVLAQVVPLLLGFGAVQFLFTADTIFVNFYFPKDETGFYVGAGTLSRALLWLVLPLAQVMFPKIVQSAMHKEKSNLVGLVLLGTLILAAVGALGLTLLRKWIIGFVFTHDFVAVGQSIMPWYAWAMVPLALANVLANNVLARGQFRVVPPLMILALAYGAALMRWHTSLIGVLQIMGGFNVLLLLVCAWFTWRQPAAKTA